MPETQRQKQKNLTRKNIIETAMQVFEERGFLNTPTSVIAKAANVSHGTVFMHFKTQEELLTAVLEEFGSRINKRLHELAQGKSGMREVLEAHIAGLAEFEKFYTGLVVEGGVLPKAARNTFTAIQSTVSIHISQAAEEEIAKGRIKQIPLHMIFNGWVGLVHYYLANKDLFSPEGPVLKRYGGELVLNYMALLEPGDGRP